MPEHILEEINESALSLLKTLDLTERYKTIVSEATRIIGVEYGTIFLHKDGELNRVFSTVPSARKTKPRKKGYAYETFLSGQMRIVSPDELKKVHRSLYDQGVHSLVLIPLAVQEERIGVLALQVEHARKFSTLECQALKLFGTLSTLAIKNAQFIDATKKSIEARDLFISLASHELKTPLTTISVYSDLIAKKINSKQMPSENAAEILRSETKRLKNIVNDLLEFDRILSGKFRYRWNDFSINDVVKKSLINFRSTHPSYKVIIENNLTRGMGVIQGDPEKLQQVISNILTNSAKFSTPFTPILLQLDNDEEYLYIAISDYGKGIKKSDQEKIFNEFYKVSGNRRQGMGLGLYLVKRIVEKHKGEISVSSKLHKGTKITVKLPTKLYESRTLTS